MNTGFKEVNESYTLPEAVREAQRCLHCKVPGCRKSCPIKNDIPEWIEELAKGNFGNAMRIINTRSNLPAVCGRVCAHERQCEGNCILSKKGVFAGGDVTNSPATVVHAMQDAKHVAEGIERYVDAVKLMESINRTD